MKTRNPVLLEEVGHREEATEAKVPQYLQTVHFCCALKSIPCYASRKLLYTTASKNRHNQYCCCQKIIPEKSIQHLSSSFFSIFYSNCEVWHYPFSPYRHCPSKKGLSNLSLSALDYCISLLSVTPSDLFWLSYHNVNSVFIFLCLKSKNSFCASLWPFS